MFGVITLVFNVVQRGETVIECALEMSQGIKGSSLAALAAQIDIACRVDVGEVKVFAWTSTLILLVRLHKACLGIRV